MKLFILFAFQIFPFIFSQRRIHNGESAERVDFPYHANLNVKDDDDYICGGVIISKKIVRKIKHLKLSLEFKYFRY